jgi:hypothetical protein
LMDRSAPAARPMRCCLHLRHRHTCTACACCLLLPAACCTCCYTPATTLSALPAWDLSAARRTFRLAFALHLTYHYSTLRAMAGGCAGVRVPALSSACLLYLCAVQHEFWALARRRQSGEGVRLGALLSAWNTCRVRLRACACLLRDCLPATYGSATQTGIPSTFPPNVCDTCVLPSFPRGWFCWSTWHRSLEQHCSILPSFPSAASFFSPVVPTGFRVLPLFI